MSESTHPANPGPSAAAARAALEAVDQSQATLARGMKTPPGVDAMYGAACGLTVVGCALFGAYDDSWAIKVAAPVTLLVAFGLFIEQARRWRDANGAWVYGYAPRRARWAAFGFGIVLWLLCILGVWAGHEDAWWLASIAVVAAMGAGIIANRLWMKLFHAQYGAGQ